MNHARGATTEIEVARQEAAIGRAVDLTAVAMDALRDIPIADRLLAGLCADLEAVLRCDAHPMRRVKQALSRAKALQQLSQVTSARHAEVFSGTTEITSLLEWKRPTGRRALPDSTVKRQAGRVA